MEEPGILGIYQDPSIGPCTLFLDFSVLVCLHRLPGVRMFVVFCVRCIPDIIASIVWRGLMSAWAICGQAVAIWLRLGYIPVWSAGF